VESSQAWQAIFENWPESIPRKGLVVTSFQETIPFVDFLVSGGLLMVERDKPDTYGTRKVMIAYEAITAVKITDPMELARFQVMGFQSPY